eukprot:c33387_g1_i1 orf=427-588(+)
MLAKQVISCWWITLVSHATHSLSLGLPGCFPFFPATLISINLLLIHSLISFNC